MGRLCADIELEQKQIDFAKDWLNRIDDGELKEEKENYLKFYEYILNGILGYTSDDIKYEKNKVEFQIIDSDGKSVLCWEVKGTRIKDLYAIQHRKKEEHRTPFNQAHFYMYELNLHYGVCTNYRKFILLDNEKKVHEFDFNDIRKDESKLKEFVYLFSKSGMLQKSLNKLRDESIIEEKDFTEKFYEIFHETRLMMITEFEHNGANRIQSIHLSQIILNRLIFIFFAEDRGLISQQQLFHDRMMKILKLGLISENSKKIFEDILDIFIMFDQGSHDPQIFGFNGGLFSGNMPLKIYFKDKQKSGFIDNVTSKSSSSAEQNLGNDVKKVMKNVNPIIKNLMILESYDFNTEVNVNILGHIFEQSISDLEELEKDTRFERHKNGVYYTPEYITNYICKNTIIPYLSKSNNCNNIFDLIDEYEGNISDLKDKLRSLKILDPACGSGAFLLKVIDVLTDIHKAILDHEATYNGIMDGQESLDRWNEEEQIKEIIENNVYGSDIYQQSVEITKLSLYLRLAVKDKKLPSFGKNIVIGNSVISKPPRIIDPNNSKKKDEDILLENNLINWTDRFQEVFSDDDDENKGFDIIVGNPPYVRQENIQHPKKLLQMSVDNTLKVPSAIIASKSDLSMYFYFHFINLLKKSGKLGFISSASWLHMGYGQQLKKMFLDNCRILNLFVYDYAVFENIGVKTATTILDKTPTLKDHNIKLHRASSENDVIKDSFEESKINQLEMKSDKNWSLYFPTNIFEPVIEMIPFLNVSDIHSGKKTGNNKFFIINNDVIQKYNISEKYYVPCISRTSQSLETKGLEKTEYLLNVNDKIGELVKTIEGKSVLEYIQDAENTSMTPGKGRDRKMIKISEGSSVASRDTWYSLEIEGFPPQIILGRFAHGRMKIYENNGNFWSKDNCVWVRPIDDHYTKPLLAYLSSSYFTLISELYGHPQMGNHGGALQILTNDWKKIDVPDFAKLKNSELEKLVKAWNLFKMDLKIESLDDVVLEILFGIEKDENKQENNNGNNDELTALKEDIRNVIQDKMRQRGRLNAYVKEMKTLQCKTIHS